MKFHQEEHYAPRQVLPMALLEDRIHIQALDIQGGRLLIYIDLTS